MPSPRCRFCSTRSEARRITQPSVLLAACCLLLGVVGGQALQLRIDALASLVCDRHRCEPGGVVVGPSVVRRDPVHDSSKLSKQVLNLVDTHLRAIVFHTSVAGDASSNRVDRWARFSVAQKTAS